MFCLVKNYCIRSGPSLRILNNKIGRSIQPRAFSPLFNSIISYADECKPDPCSGTSFPSSVQKCCTQKRQKPCGSGGRSTGGHDISYKLYVERGIMDHDYKNMTLKRPMSPHLEIFRMTQPALMSILQRITGVVVTAYALLITGGTLFLPNGIETYVSIIQSLDLSELTVNIIKLIVGLPFTYHYCNGIRFCLWNMARFLSLAEVGYLAKLVMVFCLAGAGIFAYYF